MGRSKTEWMDWDEHQVGNWLKDNGIKEEYVAAFVGNKISGKDLREVIADEDALTGLCSHCYMLYVLT